MSKDLSQTQKFTNFEKENKDMKKAVVLSVYKALQEKGYNPVNQIVGYIISGDPTYITAHNNARANITKIERDELLEEFVDFYIKQNSNI